MMSHQQQITLRQNLLECIVPRLPSRFLYATTGARFGSLTPADGDPSAIERYTKLSANFRAKAFSFIGIRLQLMIYMNCRHAAFLAIQSDSHM